ncbi:peroxidase family protein [Solirubrobacter soli]|uniref:peroxidase family protein n=1 Tax=Solirubrobacter soli TaxID=363832 RepID=UPI000426F749|nr:peroxidase family protein [Solirubrobacter soli]
MSALARATSSALRPLEWGFGHVNSTVFRQVNRVVPWYQLPLPAALLNLRALRDDLREFNLYDTGDPDADLPVDPSLLPKYRTYDGSLQDAKDPDMGMVGTRFGRNAPLDATAPEKPPRLMAPSPREVSLQLFTRDTFIPATTLNVLAACWIQFQTHDWFGHGDNSATEYLDVPLARGDTWPDKRMRVPRTSPDRTHAPGDTEPPTYINTVTHWWDGSQIYGSSEERCRSLRTGEDGKLLLDGDKLPEDAALTGVDLTGFNRNYWLGLSLLHTLFVREHNAICDHLKGSYPRWDDERLFLTARLVNAALMAKIHTIEWTPGILNTPALARAMHANWYGILPKWVSETFGHVGTEMISGIVGSEQSQGHAPYAITEEFVSVYRLHPLVPDDYEIRDHRSDALIERAEFTEIHGHQTRAAVDRWGWDDLLYSFGVANPGAITLHNHPRALQDLTLVSGERVDLATRDVLRDRERGVRRYNDFRERLRKPRLTRFSQLTANPLWAKQIEELYEGDIDAVDLQVGLLGEPVPPGFGFSDTAFRIFILMASRRLRSDRFFTDDYTPDVYTPEGLQWIDRSTMVDVLLRHHPALAPALEGVQNAFAPWTRR